MTDVGLPPCGLYRTTERIGQIPAGRLVFFHNHGNPGPGVYLPKGWRGNRARFDAKGTVLPDPSVASTLEALEPQGFYRVAEPFHCCDKQCRRFEADMLVQLGYDAEATPILFVPEMVDGQVALPERGTKIDYGRLDKLRLLKVAVTDTGGTEDEDGGPVLH